MKKLSLIFVLLLNSSLFAQSFEVTPNGLRDKADLENNYLVISTPEKTASQLFQNAIKYINQNYKNPDEVMKGRTENEYLRFETYVPQFTKVNNSGVKVPVSMKYTTELKFKDGKVRYEITHLAITADNGGYPVEFIGGIWKCSCYPIYNQKNGELRLPETKAELENYFNNVVGALSVFLNDEVEEEDW